MWEACADTARVLLMLAVVVWVLSEICAALPRPEIVDDFPPSPAPIMVIDQDGPFCEGH